MPLLNLSPNPRAHLRAAPCTLRTRIWTSWSHGLRACAPHSETSHSSDRTYPHALSDAFFFHAMTDSAQVVLWAVKVAHPRGQ